jgi:hypothetical protein
MKLRYLIITVGLSLIWINCDSILTNDSNKKHPSNYKWEIDTIQHNFDQFMSFETIEMLYYDQDDIYIVCESVHYHGIYFHYNGEQWRQYFLEKAREIESLCKFNDRIFCAAWRADHQGRILSFNRRKKQWTPRLTVDKSNTIFFDIWSDGKDNIWAGGLNGTLYHYDGQDWKDYSLSDSIWISEFSGRSMDQLYALGYCLFNGSPRVGNVYLLKWSGEKWIIVDQFMMDDYKRTKYPFGDQDLYVTDEFIYTCGHGLFKKRPGEKEWVKIFRDNYYNLVASSSDHMFAIGQYGLVNYWNGKKWQELDISHYPDIIYRDGWTDGNQLYIMGYGSDNGYLVHGR